jgi:hypothetical protein
VGAHWGCRSYGCNGDPRRQLQVRVLGATAQVQDPRGQVRIESVDGEQPYNCCRWRVVEEPPGHEAVGEEEGQIGCCGTPDRGQGRLHQLQVDVSFDTLGPLDSAAWPGGIVGEQQPQQGQEAQPIRKTPPRGRGDGGKPADEERLLPELGNPEDGGDARLEEGRFRDRAAVLAEEGGEGLLEGVCRAAAAP